MTTYYPGPDVRVTDEVFVVLGPIHREFKIRELDDIHVVRGDLPPGRFASAHIAGGALVLVAVFTPVLNTALAWAVAVALLVVSFGISGACSRLLPRTYELRATYQGYEVSLYSSPDQLRFGQVRRALIRALESWGY